MDPVSPAPSYIPTPPHPTHPHRHIRVLFWCIIIAGLIMGAYLLEQNGLLPGFAAKHPVIDVVVATATQNGAQLHETAAGKPMPYPVLPHTTITEMVRANGKTFVLGSDTQTGHSVLYDYQNGSFHQLYQDSARLGGMAISNDSKFAAFTAFDSSSSTPHVIVVPLGSATSTTLGAGYGPALMTVGGVQTVVYLNNKSILAQSSTPSGGWTAPVSLYTATAAFPLGSAVVANDKDGKFAFIEPTVGTEQVWNFVNTGPLVASPVTVYKAVYGAPQQNSRNIRRLEYTASGLWLVSSDPLTNRYSFINVANPAQKLQFTLPPQGGGRVQLLYVGV